MGFRLADELAGAMEWDAGVRLGLEEDYNFRGREDRSKLQGRADRAIDDLDRRQTPPAQTSHRSPLPTSSSHRLACTGSSASHTPTGEYHQGEQGAAQLDLLREEPDDHAGYDEAETLKDYFEPIAGEPMHNLKTEHSFTQPRIERDALVVLYNVLHSGYTLLATLDQLDEAPILPCTGSSSLGRPSEHVLSAQGSMEARVQTHLERVLEAEKSREEQIREISKLGVEMGNVQWEEETLGLMLGSWLGLGIVHEVDEGGGRLWTGDTAGLEQVQEDHVEADAIPLISLETDQLSLGPANPGRNPNPRDFDPLDLDAMLEDDPVDPNRSITLSEDPTLVHSLEEPDPSPIPPFLQASTALLESLGALAEALQQSLSASTSASRQIRGIKAGLDSWRDREMYEDHCRWALEKWEEGKMKRGLRGESGLREEVEKVVRGFKVVVEDAEGRVRVIRQQRAAMQR